MRPPRRRPPSTLCLPRVRTNVLAMRRARGGRARRGCRRVAPFRGRQRRARGIIRRSVLRGGN
eukprot:4043066-Lingulodinium_polyedra.AAC.1